MKEDHFTASTVEFDRLREFINNSKQISLIIHEKPDGDAIGSSAAFYYAFGKSKKIFLHSTSEIPLIFQEIVPDCKYQNILTKSDLYIILDCNNVKRTGFKVELTNIFKENNFILTLFINLFLNHFFSK